MELNTSGVMGPQMQCMEGALEAAKEQFDLPAISIQEDDFVGFQIESIGGDEIRFTPGAKGD